MRVLFISMTVVLLGIITGSSKPETMKNPLLHLPDTPFGTIPFDQVTPELIQAALDTALLEARQEIDAIIANSETPDFANTIEALESTGQNLDRVSRVLFNLNSAETNESIQALAREYSPKITEFGNYVSLNEELFEKISYIREHTDGETLSAEQQMLLERTYRRFVRNGANLPEEKKAEYRQITEKLSSLSVSFNENVLAETNDYILHLTSESDLSGLPEDVISLAAEEAGNRDLEGWVFTLQYPSYSAFLKYADNRALREKLLRAASSRGMHGNDHDNQQIITEIANLRLEQARMLGYDSYAAYILEDRMAGSPENVYTFLEELTDAYVAPARNELDEVEQFAQKNGLNGELQRWDWSYYAEKLRKEKFDIDEEMTKPYFQLEKVQEGIFGLINTLYGLTFRPNKEIPVYHPDVVVYEVIDADNQFLGVLYLDFFPREGKRQGAWMTEFREQCKRNGEDIRPHVSLVFNFSKPTSTKPSLLTYYEVSTFLHEFGHGLHGLMSDVQYATLSGTNVYRDFVELPSQIMENWAEQKEWLDRIAMHYETGEPIPDELIDKIIESKNYLAGYMGSRQVSYGVIDMAWHGITEPVHAGVESFENEALKNFEFFPEMPGTAMSPAFSHIFGGGYAAGYYGYKWAEVLDADAFAMFLENGIFDRETAAKFRENILSRGGTADPMELYISFRGHKPSIEPLLERSGLGRS